MLCAVAENTRGKHQDTTAASNMHPALCMGFPGSIVVKNLPANAGDMGSIPGSGRFPGGGNGNPLQYSCLENSMDRRSWWAIVHGVAT